MSICHQEMPFWDDFLNRPDIMKTRKHITKTIHDEMKEDNCLVFPPEELWYRIFESLPKEEVTVILEKNVNIVNKIFFHLLYIYFLFILKNIISHTFL